MKAAYSKVVWTIGLMGLSAAALADAPKTKPPPQEPVGFVTGAVIGGFAAGPVGAVVGAGLGTWLGNRVHRAGEARKAEAQVASLKSDKSELEAITADLKAKTAELETARSDLEETNRALTARLDQLAHSVEAAQAGKDADAREEAAKVLDGLQGDILFRTGSADIPEETSHEIETLAGVLAKSPALTVRLDGYADPRGTVEGNMKLSEERANAVRDLFLAAGVREDAARSQRLRQEPEHCGGQRRLCARTACSADAAGGRSGAGRAGRQSRRRTAAPLPATAPPTAAAQRSDDK